MKVKLILILLSSVLCFNLFSQNYLANSIPALEGGRVSDMVKFNGEVYISGLSGVWRLNRMSQEWEPVLNGFVKNDVVYSNSVRDLFVWQDDLYLINYSGKLFRLENDKWVLEHEDYEVYEVEVLDDKIYFIEREKGLANIDYYDPRKYQLVEYGPEFTNRVEIGEKKNPDSYSQFGFLGNIGGKYLTFSSYKGESAFIYKDGTIDSLSNEVGSIDYVFGKDMEHIYGVQHWGYVPSGESHNNLFELIDGEWHSVMIHETDSCRVEGVYELDNQYVFQVYQFGDAVVGSRNKVYFQEESFLGERQFTELKYDGYDLSSLEGIVEVEGIYFYGFDDGTRYTPIKKILTGDVNSNGFYGQRTTNAGVRFNHLFTYESFYDFSLDIWNINSGRRIENSEVYEMDELLFTDENVFGVDNNDQRVYKINGLNDLELLYDLYALGIGDIYTNSIYKVSNEAFLILGQKKSSQDIHNRLLFFGNSNGDELIVIELPEYFNRIKDVVIKDNEVLLSGWDWPYGSVPVAYPEYMMHINLDTKQINEVDFGSRYEKPFQQAGISLIEISKGNDGFYASIERDTTYIFTDTNGSFLKSETERYFSFVNIPDQKLEYQCDIAVNGLYGFYPFNNQLLSSSSSLAMKSDGDLTNWKPLGFNGMPEGTKITSFFKDEYGNIYLATDYNGVYKLISSNSVDEIKLESSLMVYPNPTTDVIKCEIDFNVSGVSIFNQQGKVVSCKTKFENGLVTTDVRSLNSGIYVFQILDDNGKLRSSTFVKK